MSTKHCPKCETTKPVSMFSKHSRRKDGLQSHCKECCKAAHKRGYYHGDRKKRIKERSKRHLAHLKNLAATIKLQRGCSICGYSKNPYAMDFHHEGGKDDNVGTLIRRECSEMRLLAEIEKCVVLCANCHREHHHPYFPAD